jgi:hypothetical protein
VVIVLGIMAAAMVRSALLECQTWDEGIHLAAGYSYLQTGQFRLNPEHPPLFKLLAALPLLLLRPELPTQHPSWAKANVFDFAVQFMYGNRVDADTILFWGRPVTILLTLLLGLALALWTRRSFGPAPALLRSARQEAFAASSRLVPHNRGRDQRVRHRRHVLAGDGPLARWPAYG